MITTSVRGNSFGGAFGTEIRTVPLPLPLAPLVIVIQSAVVVAVQLQPAVVVTAMLKVAPCRSNVWDAGLMAKTQPVACVSVNVRPAIVSVPERVGPLFAATVK
jgi:hypothetical protein